MQFILSLNWTDQGIRGVKDAPKRAQAARDLGKKLGVEIKEIYLTSGDADVVIIVDTPNGDNIAKFAMALGAQGNVRTRTARAWPQAEMEKLISELPESFSELRIRDWRGTLTPPPNRMWLLRQNCLRELTWWIRGERCQSIWRSCL